MECEDSPPNPFHLARVDANAMIITRLSFPAMRFQLLHVGIPDLDSRLGL